MLLWLLPRWLIALFFRSFEQREEFLTQVAEIKNKHPSQPVCFALFGAGWIEFLALRAFLIERFGREFEVAQATRLSSFLLDPPSMTLRRILYVFRLVRRPPSRLKLVAQEISAGRPTVLNFDSLERSRVFQTPLGEIELSYLAQHHPSLLIVPVTFVWRRRRRKEDSSQELGARLLKSVTTPLLSPWHLLLGDPYQPTDFRKIFIMLRQYGSSLLRCCPPVPIHELSPRQLRRRVITSIQAERRVILGPTYRSTRMIGESLLQNPSFQQLVQHLAVEEGTTELALLKRSSKIFADVSAQFSYFTVEILATVLNRIFKLIFDDIVIEDSDIEKIRQASREGALVLIPSHKSYVDFLLLSYVFFHKGVVPPHIAAGLNLNFWPMGPLFKKGGAFFIKRSFKGDPLYAEIIRRYVSELLSNRVSIEFFIEGMRSRSGKLAPPKFGMLKMIVDGHVSGLIPEKIRIVPISIVYDRVTEERAHKRELEGGAKVQESALGVVKSSSVLLKKYGKVLVKVADPIPLEDAMKQMVGEGGHSSDTLKLGIQKLAFEICHRINDVTPLTATGVICACLLSKPGAAMPRKELDIILNKLALDISRLGIQLGPDLETNFLWGCQVAITRLLHDKLLETYSLPDGSLGLKIPRRQRLAALYYKNSVIHAFLLPSIASLSRGTPANLLTLRGLLQWEFFFAEKDAFLKKVLALPAIDCSPLFGFLLDDVLENICLGLRGLLSMPGLAMDSKEWTGRLMKFGQARIEEAAVQRMESVNTTSFTAFVALAENRGWLKQQSIAKDGLLTPGKPELLKAALASVEILRPAPSEWERFSEKLYSNSQPPPPDQDVKS